MNLERELNVAVQLMFKHAKSVVTRNVTNAVRSGAITIEESKLPGLDLIIQKSIDDAYMQSAKQITETIKAAYKSGAIVDQSNPPVKIPDKKFV